LDEVKGENISLVKVLKISSAISRAKFTRKNEANVTKKKFVFLHTFLSISGLILAGLQP
jgi:hypothetical protein